MPAMAAEAIAWALRNWRAVLIAALLAVIWWQRGTIADDRERIAGRDREIRLMAETIAQRGEVIRAVAQQAAARQAEAQKAVDAATAKAADAERRLARLRSQRPQTGEACQDAAELLRMYREAQ